jgi:glycine/D-amino acid oxidase-like deaminating enzyme
MWSGLIDGMSDGLPVLGLVEEAPGFIFMTGFSGHGFGIAPISAKLMSELILDCRTSIPITDFCYTRFQTSGERDCACQGGDACDIHSTLCPNKREFLRNL